MAKHKVSRQFLVCVSNDGYPASLEVRKIYEYIPDAQAAARRFVRVIDESGEDYLFPESMFVTVGLTKEAVRLFARAS
jgi:hypothetical protein